jgi:C-terminal processing protease CtpA/Prc
VDMPAYAFIQQVQRGSPAEAAGLVVNEQIVSVDGTPVDSNNKLSVLLAKVQGGSQVTLGVLYGNQSLAVPVTLATLSPRIIDTPSAQIFLLDTTEMLLDIGPTGVTAVLVLNGVAHVK